MLDPMLNFPHQHGTHGFNRNQEVIENVQKRAVTMISGLCSNNNEELRSYSLKERRIQFDMVQTFKIVHEMDRVDRRVWLSLQ